MTVNMLRHSEPKGEESVYTIFINCMFKRFRNTLRFPLSVITILKRLKVNFGDRLTSFANAQLFALSSSEWQTTYCHPKLGSILTKKILRYAVLDFRAVDFLDFTLRLCLCHSVENLQLTSSLALLDSTLPKIQDNSARRICFDNI